MRVSLSCLLWLGLAAVASAAPPVDVPEKVEPVNGWVVIAPKSGQKVVKYVVLDPGLQPFPFDLVFPGIATNRFAAPEPKAAGTYKVLVYGADGKDDPTEAAVVRVVIGGDPNPPTPPVPPGPTPPGPTPPVPVTSFRVVVVFESGDTLTAAQRAVIYGGAVETWLTANCTGGVAGWRRRDKDAPGEQDATMAALWTAVKPKVTATPCIAVAVNDKVTLEPLPATPAAAVELLKRYREGK